MFYISTLHRFEMFDITVGEINKTTMYEQDGTATEIELKGVEEPKESVFLLSTRYFLEYCICLKWKLARCSK